MSFLRRHPNPNEFDTDEDNDGIDPELRLRTVRTAHSTIEESIRAEQRAEKRKTRLKKRSNFFRRHSEKRPTTSDTKSEIASATPQIKGIRRNIYVNRPLPPDELDRRGEPLVQYVRNKVRTSSECTQFTDFFNMQFSETLYRIYHLDIHTQESLRAISSVCMHWTCLACGFAHGIAL